MIRMPSTGFGTGVAAPYDDVEPTAINRAPAVPQRRSRPSWAVSVESNGAAGSVPTGAGLAPSAVTRVSLGPLLPRPEWRTRREGSPAGGVFCTPAGAIGG